MLKNVVPVVAPVAMFATPALALEATKTATIAASPDEVWNTIGGFCGIGDRHPVIETCALSQMGGKQERASSLGSP